MLASRYAARVNSSAKLLKIKKTNKNENNTTNKKTTMIKKDVK